jgi:polyhydroxyalkanoate synthesis regulator phasin
MDFYEYVLAMSLLSKGEQKSVINALFKLADKNLDGFLTQKEAVQYLFELFRKLTDGQSEEADKYTEEKLASRIQTAFGDIENISEARMGEFFTDNEDIGSALTELYQCFALNLVLGGQILCANDE